MSNAHNSGAAEQSREQAGVTEAGVSELGHQLPIVPADLHSDREQKREAG